MSLVVTELAVGPDDVPFGVEVAHTGGPGACLGNDGEPSFAAFLNGLAEDIPFGGAVSETDVGGIVAETEAASGVDIRRRGAGALHVLGENGGVEIVHKAVAVGDVHINKAPDGAVSEPVFHIDLRRVFSTEYNTPKTSAQGF